MPNLDITTNLQLTSSKTLENLENNLKTTDCFVNRHIGANKEEIEQMLKVLGFSTLEQLIEATVPNSIRMSQPLKLPAYQSEYTALVQLKSIASKNKIYRSFIGMGYYDCITPPLFNVIF